MNRFFLKTTCMLFILTTGLFFISCKKTYYYVDYKWDEKYPMKKGNPHEYKAKNDSDALQIAGLYLEGLIEANKVVERSIKSGEGLIYLKVDVLNSDKNFIGSVYNKDTRQNIPE